MRWHSFNCSTWEVEAGKSLRAPGQPRVHNEILSQNYNNNLIAPDFIATIFNIKATKTWNLEKYLEKLKKCPLVRKPDLK